MFDLRRILKNLKNNKIVRVENSNGTAVKFPDGTMICYGTALNNSNGLVAAHYPADFIEPPTSQQATIVYNSYTSSNPVYVIIQAGIGLTNIYCRKMDGTPETNTSIKTNWLVIGRWK